MNNIRLFVMLTLIFGLLSVVAASVYNKTPSGTRDTFSAAEAAGIEEEGVSTGSIAKGMDFMPSGESSRTDMLFVIWNALGIVLCTAALFMLIKEMFAGGRKQGKNIMAWEDVRTVDEIGASESFEKRRRSS